MKIICWEAKTRSTTVSVSSNGKTCLVWIEREHNIALDPVWARQLAHTLLAAADVADEELASLTPPT